MEKELGRGISATNLAYSTVSTSVGALIFCVSTQRCLFLMRSNRQRNTWGLVGGKQEPGETTLETLHREFGEELGSVPAYQRLIPIETYTSNDQAFRYLTYVCLVDREFLPVLNHEHHGYCWIQMGHWPRPLHPGLWNTVNFQEIKTKIDTLFRLFV